MRCTLITLLVLSLALEGYAQTSRDIFVDQQNAQASDTNPGTETLPLKTVTKGVAIILNNNWLHVATTLTVAPGMYRESIIIPPDGRETDAAITIKAKEIGKTIISGSDIWTGWTQRGTSDVYEHDWP